jgi:hypothetical protein
MVRGEARLVANSVLVCTLAYNLVFFIQELGLVLAKAATPGLHPVLFHNNHSWTGEHPLVPLLQGAGALATMAAGALCMLWLDRRPPRSAGLRLLALWMAAMGFFEALPQVVIGALVPQNDVGMALGFLDVSPVGKAAAASLAVVGCALVGRWAAPRFLALAPHASPAWAVAGRAALPLAMLVPLAVPFRVPNAWIEVVLPPAVDATVGLLAIQAWAWRPAPERAPAAGAGAVWKPLLALAALLAFFQLVLRPGVPFG